MAEFCKSLFPETLGLKMSLEEIRTVKKFLESRPECKELSWVFQEADEANLPLEGPIPIEVAKVLVLIFRAAGISIKSSDVRFKFTSDTDQ